MSDNASIDLVRCINRGECDVLEIEHLWQLAFSSVLRNFGFPDKCIRVMWDELVVGNWERLHMTDEEQERTAAEWLEQLRLEVYYCSDRWSIDRLSRCHWLFRAYRRAAKREKDENVR